MSQSTVLRRILLAPPNIRSSLVPSTRSISIATRQYATSPPSIWNRSFWADMIPKPLRKSSPSAAIKKKAKSKDWNPATFYIVIFLLIGSMSIQMIALRNEHAAFMRRADAKLGLLKEIIERVKKGETVDVEGLLGTGDAQREKEWEEVLQEIEEEDKMWEQSKSRKPKPNVQTDPKASIPPTQDEKPEKVEPKTSNTSKAPSGFY